MDVGKTGEEYYIRKGGMPAIDNWGGGLQKLVDLPRRQYKGAVQLSSVPRLDTRPSTAGVVRYIMAEMIRKSLIVSVMTVLMTELMMMIQNCLATDVAPHDYHIEATKASYWIQITYLSSAGHVMW